MPRPLYARGDMHWESRHSVCGKPMGVNAIRGARFRVVEVADGRRAQAMVYSVFESFEDNADRE